VSVAASITAPVAPVTTATTSVATAATTPAAPATTGTTATTAATILTPLDGPRFIHLERPPFQVLAIQSSDSCLGCRAIGHLDKAKTSGLAGKFIFDNRGRTHFAVSLKSLS
jgi:hypothetical protein